MNSKPELLRSLGFNAPTWQDLGYLLAGLLSALSLIGAGVALWQRRRTDPGWPCWCRR